MSRHLVTAAIFIVLLGITAAIFYAKNPSPPSLPAVIANESVEQPDIVKEEEIAQPLPSPASPLQPATHQPEPTETLQETLLRLLAGMRPETILITDGFIQRFVVTVDNLPRKKLPLSHLAARPAPGVFLVTENDDTITISPDNATRYAPYIRLLDHLDAKEGVAAYIRNYPLFQKTYREMGYSNEFNNRLIEVIDHLLASPEPVAPPSLSLHINRYRYVNPDLEDLSAGQKIMIRIGPENAKLVKTKLKKFRKELFRQSKG